MNIQQFAMARGCSTQNARHLCRKGYVHGAVFAANQWQIPDAAVVTCSQSHEMLTIAQFAEARGISLASAKSYCKSGKVPGARKFKKVWRIPRDLPTALLVPTHKRYRMSQLQNPTETQAWGAIQSRQPLLARQPKGKPYQARGLQQPHARLTDLDVQTIRELWALGVAQRQIARAYRIAQPHVSDICRREKWSHVPATDREITELGCQAETQAPHVATTGRIQRWTGTTWETHADIRRAENATGIDRMVIAQACISGTGWRYEPGIPADKPTPDLW